MPDITDDGPTQQHDARGRRQLTVAEFARHLEHPLHFEHISRDALVDGCRLARELGMAGVTCRPEHVETAAAELTGSHVAVVTGLGFYLPSAAIMSEEDLLEEAGRAVELGATEVGVIVNAARLRQRDAYGQQPFVSAITALIGHGHDHRFRVRVHLEADGLEDEEITALCRVLADAGVWMVQAGSWQGPRSSYRHLLPMRAALGGGPLLKWTTPVSSFHVVLLGLGDGVDRFNASPPSQLVGKAKQDSKLAPLAIPLAGLDY
jgi:deoxyribose-phosphate aldolase